MATGHVESLNDEEWRADAISKSDKDKMRTIMVKHYMINQNTNLPMLMSNLREFLSNNGYTILGMHEGEYRYENDLISIDTHLTGTSYTTTIKQFHIDELILSEQQIEDNSN